MRRKKMWSPALRWRRKTINQLVEFQEKIRKEIGKEKAVVALAEPDPELKAAVADVHRGQA